MNKTNVLRLLCLIMCLFMLVGCKETKKEDEKYFRFMEEIATIYVGDTYELTFISNLDEKDYVFHTDDTDIVSI